MPELGRVCVDFLDETKTYRRKFGGGRRQALAKAVGLKKGANPSVLDATAGLGSDAFVLASLGCHVHMIEQHPLIAALLEDGLNRAKEGSDIGSWVKARLSFSHNDSCSDEVILPFTPDVVYLDPMYPFKKKSALVKKEMQMLQVLVIDKIDEKKLLNVALERATNRVVVKRPIQAPFLSNHETTNQVKTKNHRFDIYSIT